MKSKPKALRHSLRVLRFAFLVAIAGFFVGRVNRAEAQSCCTSCRPNLAIDSSFADSCNNYRFHTDIHILCPIPYSMFQASYGAIIHTTNGIVGISHGLFEHTGSSHSYMLFGKDTNVPIRAWFDTVKVVNGQTYCFSVWVRNMCDSCVGKPDFQLKVGSSIIASAIQVDSASEWVHLCGSYSATATGNIELDVIVNSPLSDFAIDDISFKPNGPPLGSFSYSNINGNTGLKCGRVVSFSGDDTYGFQTWTIGIKDSDLVTRDTGISITYTFPGGGRYYVRHLVTDSCRDTTIVTDTLDIAPCCDCFGCGTDLVSDSDFITPPTTCGLGSSPNPWPVGPEVTGTTVWTNDVSLLNSSLNGSDHTGNGSGILAVNGPQSPFQSSANFWCDSICGLIPGQNYCFSAWVKNINNCTGCKLPDITLRINGDTITRSAIAYSLGWVKICGTFTAESSCVGAAMGIKAQSGSGNDLAVDDISITQYCGSVSAPFVNILDNRLSATGISNLYPNPLSAGSILYVDYFSKTAATANFEIEDMSCKTVLNGDISVLQGRNTYHFQTDKLSPGLYLMTLHNFNQQNEFKFVIY